MNVSNEIDVLQHATMTAAAALTATESQKQKTLALLKDYEVAVQDVKTDVHQRLKKDVILTIRAAIRYLTTGKQSDAKLTRRNGEKVAIEFGRLKRLAQRSERET